MDNYEVNVLTRKGGWKKLPQEVIVNKEEMNSLHLSKLSCLNRLNNSDSLQKTIST